MFSLLSDDFILYLCGCVSEGVYMHVCVSVHGDQKRALDLVELEFQVVVSYLIWLTGTELGSSGRAAITLNC